ncbi:MAG TPA: signal peptidase I [Verrucomicrobiae bacterium]|jgi:signal peptidase I|nr:signal peptidase I [Verrucomicrobiae bacterium]
MAGETNTRGISGWLLAIVIGRRPDRTLIRLGLLIGFALVAFLIFSFVLYPVRITGPSMYPTYRNGQINFINRLAYLRSEPKRGDVVGIRFSGNHVMYVKRIVGMPGESIAFSGGTIYINGKPLDEPYLKFPSTDWESPPKQLGPREYYVVGDNRSMPFEYHEKGAAQRERIIGKILLPGAT